VFVRDDDGDVFHTYTAYARGSEPLLGTLIYLDLTPMGRPYHIGEVPHHDRYGETTRQSHIEFLLAEAEPDPCH
jgi:predicted dithiol-disulfide oxidoreductase (DUF899 family)